MMRLILTVFIVFLICFQGTGAWAADLNVSAYPLCFKVRNTADYTVYGSVYTDYYPLPEGGQSRHNSDFRLSPAGTIGSDSRELDVAEFCTYGPYYEQRSVELILRTLFPIFSCKTRVDRGEILIKSVPQDDGSTKTKAICYR